MKQKISFGTVAKFVWKYYKRRPWAIVLIIFSMVIQAGLELALPYYMGEVTDRIAETSIQDPQFAFWHAFELLLIVAAVGASFHILNKATHSFYDWYVKCPAMRDSAIDVFSTVQRFSSDWHNNSFAGAIVTKIKRGMYSVEKFGDSFYDHFIRVSILMTGILIFLTIKWPLMGLLFAIGSTVYITVSIWMAIRFIAPQGRRWVKSDSKLGAQLADSVTGNATVKTFAKEGKEDKIFVKTTQSWMLKLFHLYVRFNSVGAFQNLVMTMVKISLFTLAVFLWSEGEATVGDFAFVVGIYALLSGHLRQIGDRVRETQRAANDMEEMVEYSLTHLQVADEPGAKPIKVKGGKIELKKVRFRYPGQKEWVYKNFSLTIQPGEKIALVGHSGGGKSTFVKLIQRLYDIDAGEILIDDQNVAKVTQQSLRESIALVPQDPILFHRTLLENISYGAKKATKKQILEAAKKAHVEEFIDTLPKKYNTLVGERGVKLSGGQRQRIAIARAMLSPASILILDEATSSLDSISEKYIQEALAVLQKNKTTIIIAHRLSTIKSADRILVLNGGKVVEEGKHSQLLKKKGKYAELWDHQVGGFM